DDGDLEGQFARGLHDAVGHIVAAGDAAEDIEQNCLHASVAGDDVQRVHDLLRIGAAADVEEVGGLAAVVLHQVHRRHREAGAVHAAANGALELDEREPRGARLYLGRRFGAGVTQGGDVGPAVQLVVVDDDLGI